MWKTEGVGIFSEPIVSILQANQSHADTSRESVKKGHVEEYYTNTTHQYNLQHNQAIS